MIGLGVGATAGVGLIAFIIYKEVTRRRSQCLQLQTSPLCQATDITDRDALLLEPLNAQGRMAQQDNCCLEYETQCCLTTKQRAVGYKPSLM